MREDRRGFVLAAGGLLLGGGAASLLSGCSKPSSRKEEEEEVSPAEDLMREHGVLNRVLLVYEESAQRLAANSSDGAPPEVITGAADIIRRFIEQYHEKLEEDFLFPRFEKASKLVDLVATLRKQHAAGRALTETIRRLAGAREGSDREQLIATMKLFVRMYRPHEAREDTVLFPALPSVIGSKELAELGERFEDKEHELFGKAGFHGIVDEVAKLERALGIDDLEKFTPHS